MWAGGPAMPSPGEPQAEPTIGNAINGGYDLLEAKCNRCDRVSLVALGSLIGRGSDTSSNRRPFRPPDAWGGRARILGDTSTSFRR